MDSAALIRQKNCLNTIRLLAALQVMLQHLQEHFVLPPALEPLRLVLSLFPGVPLFFMLSGFLIWNSLDTTASYPLFLKKRFLRIYPELWVSVAFELLCLVLLNPEPIPLPELLLFAFGQATVFQFWKPASVTGYGTGTPNGALWTIPVMVLFYVLVWWIHKTLKGKKFSRWIPCLLLSIALALAVPAGKAVLPEILYKLLRYSLIPHFWLFLAGMLTARWVRLLLPVLKKYWYLLLLAELTLINLSLDFELGYYGLFNSLLLFWAWLGFAYRFPGLRLSPDISYGVYIYHMLIVNLLMTLFGPSTPWLVPASLLLSLLAGFLSTKFIGSLAKYIKQKFLTHPQ